MRHICLGISKSKISPCWASEKVLLATGIPAEGFKGDQDLDNGPAQGEERATVRSVGLDSDQRDKEGDVWRTLPTGSFHRGISRTSKP